MVASGHIIGYEHLRSYARGFVNAVVDGKSVQPTLRMASATSVFSKRWKNLLPRASG